MDFYSFFIFFSTFILPPFSQFFFFIPPPFPTFPPPFSHFFQLFSNPFPTFFLPFSHLFPTFPPHPLPIFFPTFYCIGFVLVIPKICIMLYLYLIFIISLLVPPRGLPLYPITPTYSKINNILQYLPFAN